MNDMVIAQALRDAHRSSNGWWRANCPFCVRRIGKPDKKRSFGIKPDEGAYHCFRCGTAGDVKAELLHGFERDTAVPVVTEPVGEPEGYVALGFGPGATARTFEPARAYLRKRRLDEKMWAPAKIGACTTGRYAGRVIVPVLAGNGRTWLGWVGRAWSPQAERPYHYPMGMKRGEVLYNHAALTKVSDVPVMIVEGVFDALALWPDGVAVLGKPSPWQVEAMRAAKRPVAIVLDGDAWVEGEALAMLLRFDGQRAGSVRLPPRIDPDEVPLDELRQQALESIHAG